MNTKIKELAESAGGVFSEMTGRNLDKFDTEKFATLVIQECIASLRQIKATELPFLQAVNESIAELPLSVYIALLREHFDI